MTTTPSQAALANSDLPGRKPLQVSPEDMGYLRLYFAIFGIELSDVLDVESA